MGASMRRYALFLLAALCFVGAPGRAFAGRPLITDDTSTQGKGGYLFEVGMDYAEDSGDGQTATRQSASVELDSGITERVDLTVSTGYQFLQIDEQGNRTSPRGNMDTLLELKWRFYDSGSGLSLAVKPGLCLPTGNYTKGTGTGDFRFGSGDVRPRLYLVGTHEVGPLAFHLNLGYMRNINNYNAQKDLWHGSLAAQWRVMKRLRLVCNVGIDTNPDRGTTTDPAFLLGGVSFSVTERIDVDLGFKYGLAEPGYDRVMTGGFAIKF